MLGRCSITALHTQLTSSFGGGKLWGEELKPSKGEGWVGWEDLFCNQETLLTVKVAASCGGRSCSVLSRKSALEGTSHPGWPFATPHQSYSEEGFPLSSPWCLLEETPPP